MTSRPLTASRRNPLAVIEPSGYSSAAATSSRSGASSATSSRGGNVSVRDMDVRKPACAQSCCVPAEWWLEIVQAIAERAERRLVEPAVDVDRACRVSDRCGDLGERDHLAPLQQPD